MGWKNDDQRRAYNRKYYSLHKDRVKNNAKRYFLRHHEQLLPYWRNWYHAHKDTRLPYDRKRRALLRYLVLEKLGLKCAQCGFDDVRALQINHKKGGGSQEQKIRGSLAFYRAILAGTRAIDDLETRCANCNSIYEYERGYRKLALRFDEVKKFLIDNPQMRDEVVRKIRENLV